MNRQIITFSADEQKLTKTGGISCYASNIVSYIEAHFALGQNWSGYDSVRAVWFNDYKTISTVLDSNGVCIVPHEVLVSRGKVMVNLVGSVLVSDELSDRLTTFPCEALKVSAKAKISGSETAAVTPSQFEQFVASVRNDADRAEAGAESAEASASEASASAEQATASAQASEASALRASGYASDAQTSERNASEYAQNAQNSATSAENAKDDAENARDEILSMRATAETLAEGSQATASYSDGVLTLGIPRGDTGARGEKGETGETGATPNFTIGTVETLEPTESATATITGTAENPVLNLGLPQGRTGEVSQAELDSAVSDLKSDISDNGVVAGSNGLVSDSKISDSVPYLFRQTADGTRVGNVVEEEIVGGTVAWNQLADPTYMHASGTESDVAFTKDGGKLTVSGTASANIYARVCGRYTPTSGHKMLFIGAPSEIANVTFYDDSAVRQFDGETTYALINASGVTIDFKMRILSGSSVNGTVIPQIFDLTQMFGSTIADYIYSLEQANAGAGVAWFKKYFPKPYYAYNAGELMSVKALRHITRGFNAWDEVLEDGGIDITTGQNVGDSAYMRSKNYILVLPNTSYYYKAPQTILYARIFQYDADKKFISYTGTSVWLNNTFTTSSDTHYLRFILIKDYYGTTYKSDICINISSDRNGQYEPYQKRTYALDSSLTLRGTPKLNANNNWYYDGDVYESDGTVTRKYGIVDLGTLTYAKDTALEGVDRFWVELNIVRKPNDDNVNDAPKALCPKFVSIDMVTANANYMIGAVGQYRNRLYFFTTPNTYANATAFKTAMSGVMLVYELATPTTETAEPYTNPQIVDKYGTEEYVTTGIVPVGHNSKYSEDLKGKVESLPWDFSTLIAPTETAYKATRNYTSGSLLIVNNVLYKVTANIANGANIVPNTNVTATTLSEVIANL